MRARICAGNWKMHKTATEAVAYALHFCEIAAEIPDGVQVVLCPPFTALAAVSQVLGGSRVVLGAQNMHWERAGALTGEIAAPMLLDLGVRYVILGHSERRTYFGETDEDVRRKTRAALDAGLTPIVAVGEPLAVRESGKQVDHVVYQTRAALEGLPAGALRNVVLAYEPVWAIGTGKNCDAADANAIMREIRASVPGLDSVPVLYGGSVKAANAAEYAAQPEIDGGLVGGASLDADTFAALASAMRPLGGA